jgi:acetyl esterase
VYSETVISAATAAVPLHDRAQRLLPHGLFALPTALKRRVAGPPVTSGPAPLALDAQLLVAATKLAGFSLVIDESAQASRAALRAGAHALRGRPDCWSWSGS